MLPSSYWCNGERAAMKVVYSRKDLLSNIETYLLRASARGLSLESSRRASAFREWSLSSWRPWSRRPFRLDPLLWHGIIWFNGYQSRTLSLRHAALVAVILRYGRRVRREKFSTGTTRRADLLHCSVSWSGWSFSLRETVAGQPVYLLLGVARTSRALSLRWVQNAVGEVGSGRAEGEDPCSEGFPAGAPPGTFHWTFPGAGQRSGGPTVLGRAVGVDGPEAQSLQGEHFAFTVRIRAHHVTVCGWEKPVRAERKRHCGVLRGAGGRRPAASRPSRQRRQKLHAVRSKSSPCYKSILGVRLIPAATSSLSHSNGRGCNLLLPLSQGLTRGGGDRRSVR